MRGPRSGILLAMSSNDPRHEKLRASLLPKLASLVKDGRWSAFDGLLNCAEI